jgi:hypothetical protein
MWNISDPKALQHTPHVLYVHCGVRFSSRPMAIEEANDLLQALFAASGWK